MVISLTRTWSIEVGHSAPCACEMNINEAVDFTYDNRNVSISVVIIIGVKTPTSIYIIYYETLYGQVMTYASRIECHSLVRHELTTNRYRYTLWLNDQLASDCTLLTADAQINSYSHDSNPQPVDPKASVILTTPQHNNSAHVQNTTSNNITKFKFIFYHYPREI